MVETGIRVQQSTVVSPFADMDIMICRKAKDVTASIVIVPFHRFQRVDGKMIGGRDGIRTVNMSVLKKVPCTMGILVDRGLSGMTHITTTQGTFHVAALFFGGPDDREAMAFGGRLALHPGVSFTVVKFLPSDQRQEKDNGAIRMQVSKEQEVLVEITDEENETETDGTFFSSFYNRFVVSGKVNYQEKFMEDGANIRTTIAAMEGLFSLFLVGKGAQSPLLTTGLGEWEEFPELGPVGNFLASSGLTTTSSVLVLQQQCSSNSKEEQKSATTNTAL